MLTKRICKRCEKEFMPNSGRQLYCRNCRDDANRERALRSYYTHREERKAYVTKYNREYYQGMRRGYNQYGTNNNNYVNGARSYQKAIGDKCERCGSTYYLLVHHKDRDRSNNDPENLETLCKSCHQREHEVWKNFTKGIVRLSEKEESDK